MTLSNTDRSVTVQGDGLTTTFSYDFYMGGSANYAVLVYTDENGDQSTLASSSFSITGVTSDGGGTFTYPLAGSPIAVSTSLTLSRVVPLTQDVAIGNQGNFYPAAVERGLDYLMMAMQQVGQTINAQSLFGNPTNSAGYGTSIALGSGLSLSGNTLVVSGVSGSGTVTEINTGTGLSGGPITGVGTVSMSPITTSMVLANFSGATAAPRGVAFSVGSGLTLSSTTTSITISATATSVLISEVTTTGSQSSVTFSSITSSYRDLEIRFRGRGTTAGDTVNLSLQFNGDTGSNYSYVLGLFNGAASPSAGNTGQTSILRIGDIPAANATANYPGLVTIVIGDYRGTTFFKMAEAQCVLRTSASTLVEIAMGAWASTSAITSVRVFPSTGAIVDGSVVSLYGNL